MSWALSKEAFTHGGHTSQESKPTACHHPAPGRRPREPQPSSRPAHLRENGGLVGRLVLLLLLGSSFLHLFPVGLLFPVSSLWLQVQSTGVQLVQSGQRQLSKKDPGLSDSPKVCSPPLPRAQESRQDLWTGQHLSHLLGIKHTGLLLEPFPFLTRGNSQPAMGSCHSAAQVEKLGNNLYQATGPWTKPLGATANHNAFLGLAVEDKEVEDVRAAGGSSVCTHALGNPGCIVKASRPPNPQDQRAAPCSHAPHRVAPPSSQSLSWEPSKCGQITEALLLLSLTGKETEAQVGQEQTGTCSGWSGSLTKTKSQSRTMC